MITYLMWKEFIDAFNICTTKIEKISSYAFCSFFSIITILLDIVLSMFGLLGIVIYLITK